MVLSHCSVLLFALTACRAYEATTPADRREIPPQPRAAIRVEQTEHYSTRVIDPYRWMEDVTSSEFQAWSRGQNAHTRATLDRLTLRRELLDRIRTLGASRDEARNVQTRSGRRFFLKRPAFADTFKLYIREGEDGAERVLVDPEAIRGHLASIDYYQPSPSGRYVAFGISAGGSEDSVLRVVNTDTAQLLPDMIDRARHGEPRWRPGEDSLFYRRNPEVPSGATTAKYQRSRAYLHVLGHSPDNDVAIFGYNVSSLVPIAATDSPYVYVRPGCNYLFGVVQHGTSNDITIYVAPLAAVDGAQTPWKKLADVDDKVLDWTVHP